MADQLLRVCIDCIGNAFLQKSISKDEKDNPCDFCGETGPAASIEDISELVETAFEQHFYRTPTHPDALEEMLIRHGNLDWYRKGMPVVEVIEERAGVTQEIATAIQEKLNEKHYCMDMAMAGEEWEFDDESHYEFKEIEGLHLERKWLDFVRVIKEESRFFSRTAQDILDTIFVNIEELETSDNKPVIIEAGPEAELNHIFRARVVYSFQSLQKVLTDPCKEIGPPISKIAKGGRMNPEGIPVFYGATSIGTAIAEVRPPIGSQVVVGKFDFVRTLRILDVEALRQVYVTGDVFDPGFLSKRERAAFLQKLDDLIARPVMPNDEVFDYLPTQAIAEYLSERLDPPLDGILFKSVQTGGEGRNIVLFNKASFVEPDDKPPGTDTMVYYSGHPEEELELVISETTPVPSETPSQSAGDYFCESEEDVIISPDPSLKLDPASLQVFHIGAVSYDKDETPLRRHRMTTEEEENVPF